jgi:hypothetical protein
MKLLDHDHTSIPELAEALESRDLIFGIGSECSSLITPSSVLLDRCEFQDLESDLEPIWEFYRVWTDLYLKSLAGAEPDWIREFCEHGLSKRKVRVQKIIAEAGLEPKFARLDYVSLGANRKIVEVQWKSGGIGLFSGIIRALRDVYPCREDAVPCGDLIENFIQLIKTSSDGLAPVAVNILVYRWLKSEHFLKQSAEAAGVSYFPITTDLASKYVFERGADFVISEGRALHPVSFFYGRYFGALFKEGLFRLAGGSTRGAPWVETPLNYIYQQKWGLALPFMPEFRGLFPSRLREVLAPTILLNRMPLDLSVMFEPLGISTEYARSMTELQSLADLPGSLRSKLVLKCGAGTGELHSHGKGVLRISGSRANALKTLDLVAGRMFKEKEPWILQPYLSEKISVQMAMPCGNDLQTVNAHARYMIFAVRLNNPPKIAGGLANFGAHWKVSGKAPVVGGAGTLGGTAFTDIRVRLK